MLPAWSPRGWSLLSTVPQLPDVVNRPEASGPDDTSWFERRLGLLLDGIEQLRR